MTVGDPRYRTSRVTAFYSTPPRRVTRSSPPIEWVVVVTSGSIADHHRFTDRFDAEAFALTVDPDFTPPQEG